jgi:hypothetical protein
LDITKQIYKIWLNKEFYPVIQVDFITFYGSYPGYTVLDFINSIESARKQFCWTNYYTLKRLIGALGPDIYRQYRQYFCFPFLHKLEDVYDWLKRTNSEVGYFTPRELNHYFF